MDSSTTIKLLLAEFALICGLIYVVHLWLKDIAFYRENNWDFTKSNGQKMYHSAHGAFSKELTNKGRVYGGYPTLILVLIAMIIAFAAPYFLEK